MAWRSRQTMPSQSNPSVDRFLLKGLGEPIKTFSATSDVATTGDIQLKDFKPIASYSWISAKTPTIALVPGSPRVWANTPVTRVPADSGLQYIDQNAARMQGHSPLLPLFIAVENMDASFRYGDLDLVTDRNNLRKLLRFVTKDEKDFRIDIDLAGNTCLFTRCEEKNQETIGRGDFRGFGHEYEEAATTATRGCEKATGHHRIVSYDFGGLKVLLRFEVDACVATSASKDDELLAALSTLKIGSRGAALTTAPPSVTPSTTSALSVNFTVPGTLTPQGNMIEIKTRALKRQIDWAEVYPQLYLSQTAYLYIAKHDRGTFQPVQKIQLNGPTMTEHAEKAKASMRELKMLLGQILEVVRNEGKKVQLSLVCQGGRLTLYKRTIGSGYPVDEYITKKFTGNSISK
ncbi:hypothetical protein PAXRUDRAFT_139076 [Paxillus rubicundulus Ve08.2h10]|uniref:Geranylgeranyl pyrophosphate synthetase n=1 Tax=Paxillus rubicundulus Ve08.2h10 TaxID=930991 RepID=A0A0D0E4K9_9AGAM|nr:hypothetical protein PAXRUDRAFT_139076 [Paxillus rubicundulus Ve08.2h10]